MKKTLTDKQRFFCKEYLIDLNATQAAIRAGYSKKTARDIGCENLAKPNIASYIQEQMKKRSDKTEITADYVLNGIKNITERCSEEDGFNPSAALKGHELLGKHLKIFTEVHENKHTFTQMGKVNVGEDKEKKSISFDIGSVADDDEGE